MARKLQPGEWVRWPYGDDLLRIERRVRQSAVVSVLIPGDDHIYRTTWAVRRLERTAPTEQELERWCLARLEH